MKQFERSTLVAAAVLFTVIAAVMPAGCQNDTLTVIHVNDSHSDLSPYASGEYGGIARAATVIGGWKMTEPNPILIHAGDFLIGSLMFNAFFGVPELQILNGLGWDVLCLGNHEFDVGPVQLAEIFAQAGLDSGFNVICTNAVNLDSVPALKAVVRPYAVEQRGNVKIGFIGLTTPATNVESNPAPILLSDQIPQIVGQAVMDLKAQGCQVVILVSHLGLTLDREIAAGLAGVDAIIGGHTHDALEQPEVVNGIPIVQAGEFYHYVGKLRLVYDGTSTTVLDYTLQEITSAVPAEPSVQATVDFLQAGVAAQFSPVIGDPYQAITFAPELLCDQPASFDTLDTPMGNLVTAAMLDYVETADCAMEATGHIVEKLYPGPVTAADLFRTYPYGYEASDGLGFRMVSFDLPGALIQTVIGALLAYVNPQAKAYDYLIQSAGLDFTITVNASGEMQLTDVQIKGRPLDPDSIYTIASSSQIVGYLQKLFGIEPGNLTIFPVSVFQVVKEYTGLQDTLSCRMTGHNLAVYEDTGIRKNPGNTIHGFRLGQNYPNPFNSETCIRFSLRDPTGVNLSVYNVQGERMSLLCPGSVMPAGEHTIRFRSDNLPSGIYLLKLATGSATETRKMMLLR
ncbi:5'-nucleotidase C-terminal domain-containing protein [bacterium]|nr:5'-nucleotidase C-terminal domain-containing protein [bacterium]